MNKIIKIGNAKFWIDANDILYCKFKGQDPNYKLDKERVKMYINSITQLCNGKKMLFIIDMRDSVGTFSPEAATLLAKSPELKKLKVFEVYVYNSISMKLLIATYKRIFEPITPYTVFNNMEAAKEYCLNTKDIFYGSI